MQDYWYYEKQRRFDKRGQRWHFVHRNFFGEEAGTYDEQPYELYFRNDDRTEFGLLSFEKCKDNPYRDYPTVVNKIMNDEAFRKSLLAPETEDIWLNSWK